jgi:novobiocin biosynthesis protein NovU/D-mycarose 3-C-methyltransferase
MRVTECRICGEDALTPVLDYGRVALADGFLDAVPPADEPTYPLALCICERCGHLQIDEIVNPELLFRDYIYLTGVSETVLRHAQALHDAVRGAVGNGTRPSLRVVEAASNDGTILSVFKQRGCEVLGIDPARNIARIANERGIETVAEFFNQATATAVAKRFPDADVFLARNVLAHVAGLHSFVEGIGTVLAPDGVGVIEVPHALTMFDELQYDQVFHEHIGYYTLDSLRTLFARHGLRVFRVDEVAIHGGSVRVYLCREGSARAEDPSVARVLGEERRRGLGTVAAWRAFAGRVAHQKGALVGLLRALKAEGRRLAAYGASGKGQAMLQFCGIDRRLIDYVVDKSDWKQGKFTPGTHIPVVGPERLRTEPPDVLLLSAWNFADEIRRQQHEYVERGGRMLHPLPEPHYLD